MPDDAGFTPLTWGDPSVDEVVTGVLHAFHADANEFPASSRGIVFAGLGDPLLKWRELCSATTRIRKYHPDITVRMNTNGLLLPQDDPRLVAAALAMAGVKSASVAIGASTAKGYTDIVLRPPTFKPAYHSSAAEAVGEVEGASFSGACEFLTALCKAGVNVTVTCVARPGVDVTAVERLSSSLGAKGFKERTWHG